jgi:hypothetical protein
LHAEEKSNLATVANLAQRNLVAPMARGRKVIFRALCACALALAMGGCSKLPSEDKIASLISPSYFSSPGGKAQSLPPVFRLIQGSDKPGLFYEMTVRFKVTEDLWAPAENSEFQSRIDRVLPKFMAAQVLGLRIPTHLKVEERDFGYVMTRGTETKDVRYPGRPPQPYSVETPKDFVYRMVYDVTVISPKGEWIVSDVTLTTRGSKFVQGAAKGIKELPVGAVDIQSSAGKAACAKWLEEAAAWIDFVEVIRSEPDQSIDSLDAALGGNQGTRGSDDDRQDPPYRPSLPVSSKGKTPPRTDARKGESGASSSSGGGTYFSGGISSSGGGRSSGGGGGGGGSVSGSATSGTGSTAGATSAQAPTKMDELRKYISSGSVFEGQSIGFNRFKATVVEMSGNGSVRLRFSTEDEKFTRTVQGRFVANAAGGFVAESRVTDRGYSEEDLFAARLPYFFCDAFDGQMKFTAQIPSITVGFSRGSFALVKTK